MDVQAFMTGLRRVSWVNQDQLYPKLNALVLKELAQLEKRPTIRATAFRLASRQLVSAFSDSGQILKGNHFVAGLGILDKLKANGVIQPSLIASFLARQTLQEFSASSPCTPCSFRGFLLEMRS
jgi:hypothetical protein